jgi:Mrp family chromosome partitioning ATPase
MAAVLDELRGTNDLVLVDSPPLLPVADSSGLAVYTDGVLLSVRFGSTRKEQLRQAATVLHRVGVNVLGVVLNIVPRTAEGAYAYGYGYEYTYEDKRAPEKGDKNDKKASGAHARTPASVAVSAEE